MQMICHPEINNESSLPIYVTGVGINNLQLPCSSSSERLFIVSEGTAAITVEGQKHALPKGSICRLGKTVSAMPEPKNASARFSWITFAGSAAVCPGLFTEKAFAVFRRRKFRPSFRLQQSRGRSHVRRIHGFGAFLPAAHPAQP